MLKIRNIILFYLLIAILNSCNSKPSPKAVCVLGLTYHDAGNELVNSSIEIEISDSLNTIRNAAQSEKLKNIIFYSIEKNQRPFFPYSGFKIPNENNRLFLFASTSVFDGDRNHQWSSNEVEEKMKTNIGIVIGNDTLKIEACKQ